MKTLRILAVASLVLLALGCGGYVIWYQFTNPQLTQTQLWLIQWPAYVGFFVAAVSAVIAYESIEG